MSASSNDCPIMNPEQQHQLKPCAKLDPDTEIPGESASSDGSGLEPMCRTPHPYHHQQSELLDPAGGLVSKNSDRHHPPPAPAPLSLTKPDDIGGYNAWRQRRLSGSADASTLASRTNAANSHSPRLFQDSTTTTITTPATGSDSATDADDEHFLKGLPAPRHKPHKGVRGFSEPASGAATPLLPPQLSPQDKQDYHGPDQLLAIGDTAVDRDKERDETRKARKEFLVRRVKVVVRRGTEAALLGMLALAVASNSSMQPLLRVWGRELVLLVVMVAGLTALYPPRLAMWAYERGRLTRWLPINIFRSSFDPAPLFYPPVVTMLVALLTSPRKPEIIIPNLILSLCSVPHRLVPFFHLHTSVIDPIHWAITLLPLVWAGARTESPSKQPDALAPLFTHADPTYTLLYPVHQATAAVLRSITATSLLPAELQLLTTGLINLLLFSRSPQMLILAGTLWIGGVCTLVFSGSVIRWGISLARVPTWRFRRTSNSAKKASVSDAVKNVVSIHRIRGDIFGLGRAREEPIHNTDSSDGETTAVKAPVRKTWRKPRQSAVVDGPVPARHRHKPTHTPAGRRKRTIPVSLKPFLKMTVEEAAVCRWLYAGWVYGCGVVTYLVGRVYLMQYVFHGYDPICWALAYVFGDLHRFRLEVIKLGWDNNIIPLPRRDSGVGAPSGWVEQLRRQGLGAANTRLALTAYFVVVMTVGFSIVFRLKHVCEVDTRRKGFHFMMVVWWLPTIFIDPAFVAILFIANLALFLVVDLLRASQLPPLSQPVAAFIAPYVDGRDLAGPVVVSPIFLVIGCAIPLWLSLASLPRTPIVDGLGGDMAATGVELPGWEVPTREVAMVAGVVCVGLGDAAASLIGRRWGYRKWIWGGSKSVEGSIAFAVGVFVGLVAAKAWLVIGRWAVAGEALDWGLALRNTAVCAGIASVTEAALTGGNDNVIVPVMLWTCVKGLGI